MVGLIESPKKWLRILFEGHVKKLVRETKQQSYRGVLMKSITKSVPFIASFFV